jgi:ATP-binding cassette subfamily B (MDR/TAP) protein 1
MRFYPPSSGEILIDGNPIDALNINWVRNNITLVEQRSVLFNDSVLKNIAFGRQDYETVSAEDVQNSINVAMLKSVLESLPDGLDTCVGPGGNHLSGGQKQRVAIARARLRDTPILILDEPTNTLDPANRVAMMKAIREWRSGKTTIIITHEMSHITEQDYVYILENGTIVQSGYRDTVEKQPGSEKYFRATTKEDVGDFSLRKEPGERAYYGLSWEDSSRHSLTIEPTTPPLARHNPREILAGHHARSSSWSGTWNSASRGDDAYSFDDTMLNISYDLSQRGSILGIPRMEASPVRPGSFYCRPMDEFEMAEIDHGFLHDRSLRTMSYASAAHPDTERPALARKEIASASKLQKEQNEKCMTSLSRIMGTIVPTLTPKQRVILFLGVASALAHASATPVFSYCLSQLFSTFYAGTNSAKLTMTWSLAVLGVSIGDGLASFFMHYFLEYCGEAWMDTLRKKAFDRVLDQPRAWFEQDGNSSFRLTAYLDQNGEDMRNLLGRFAGFVIVAASITVMAIIWSLIVCWKLTLVALACGPFIYAITRGFERVNGLWEHRCSEASAVASDIFTETFSEIRTVRTLTLEGYFHNKQAKAISKCLAVGLKRAGYTGLLFGLLESTVMFASGKSFLRN